MKELALRILQEETDGFESQSRLRDDVLDAMVRFKNESEQLTKPAVVGRSEQCDHPKDMGHGTGYLECQYCIKCGKQL